MEEITKNRTSLIFTTITSTNSCHEPPLREKVILDCLYQREERGEDDRRRSPRQSWCPSTTQLHTARPPPRAWSAGVAAVVMGATMWIFGARFFGTFWWQRTRGVRVIELARTHQHQEPDRPLWGPRPAVEGGF